MDKVYGEGKTKKAAKKVISERRFAVSPLYDRMCGYSAVFDRKIVDNPGKEKLDQVESELEKETERWYQYFSFNKYLHPTSKAYKEDKEMVCRLFRNIYLFSMKNGMTLYQGTKEYLKSAALYGTQMTETDDTKDSVRFMTLHASKGLEFSCVFLIGVNQGLIPLPGKTPEAEEEERRLFFVGMTRAKDMLELSYYTNPGQPGVLGGPGWYLKMLPDHLLEWAEKRGEEEKRNHLQDLRRAVEEKRRISESSVREIERDTFKSGNEQQGESRIEKKDVIVEDTPPAGKIIDDEMKNQKRVRHPKYGEGILVSENDMTVEVIFENYGKKSFMKAFSGLIFL